MIAELFKKSQIMKYEVRSLLGYQQNCLFNFSAYLFHLVLSDCSFKAKTSKISF